MSVPPVALIGLRRSAVPLAILFALALIPSLSQSQTLTILHAFRGTDGAFPESGVTMDRGGNLYGTTFNLEGSGYGQAYKLQHQGDSWVLNRLYAWNGFHGGGPVARLILGRDGLPYGTTSGFPNGSVFKLKPQPTVCQSAVCLWTEDILYEFGRSPQPNRPMHGDLVFDAAGNIYGTTSQGGTGCEPNGCGTVFKLMPSGSGWTETTLHEFSGSDGAYPLNSVIFDSAGNMYGTTSQGGSQNFGTVFKLSCTPACVDTVLYNLTGASDGRYPYGGLISDNVGNLYGSTTDAGTGGGGTVFALSPSAGGWTFTVLYSFGGQQGRLCGPYANLAFDSAGNLYGTTYCDGNYESGNIFKLTPAAQPPWSFTSLHAFNQNVWTDGFYPMSNVIFDASGNMYGTTEYGGTFEGVGTVWRMTP